MFYEDIKDFGEDQVSNIALQFSNVGLVIIGAGPPCQGVSGLNSDKKGPGALKDSRSCLFQEIPGVEGTFRRLMPWAQVHRLMESVLQCLLRIGGLCHKGVPLKAFGLTPLGLLCVIGRGCIGPLVNRTG